MFQIGLCYPMNWDVTNLREPLARLKRYGFDGVEFWPVSLDKIEITALAEILRETGMACAQICPYFDFVHGQQQWD